ncbi:unnamed protein product, partial [Polarella glacialis]
MCKNCAPPKKFNLNWHPADQLRYHWFRRERSPGCSTQCAHCMHQEGARVFLSHAILRMPPLQAFFQHWFGTPIVPMCCSAVARSSNRCPHNPDAQPERKSSSRSYSSLSYCSKRGKADSDARTSPLLLPNVKAVVHDDDVPTWTSSSSPVASLSMRATLPLKPPSIDSELPRRCLQVGRRRAEEIAPAESPSLAREASAHSLPGYFS